MVRIVIDTESDEEGWKKAGEVSVDTGRIMIVDPCYLDNLEESPSELVDAIIKTDLMELCDVTGDKMEMLRQDPDAMARVLAQRKFFGDSEIGLGAVFFASKTGYGDGRYPVFAKMENDRVVGLWIDFECGNHLLEG